MKNIVEKLKINEEASLNNQYASNWQWFNALITNVNLTEENFIEMFANLTSAELNAWIKEIKNCYTGTGTQEEKEAQKISNKADLAKFYAKYPVEI